MNKNIIKIRNIVQSYGKPVGFKLTCVIIGFVNSILINRCLGVALRGEYTLITNWASLLQLFLNLGIGSAYPAFKRRKGKSAKKIFATITFLISLFYGLIVIIAIPFSTMQVKYVILIAFITTVENLLVFIAIVEDVTKRNAINILTASFHTIVLVGIFLLFRQNLHAMMVAILFDHIVLCVAFVVVYKTYEIDLREINFNLLKEVFYVAIPAMLMNMLMYLNYHADVLFLGALTNNSVEVGLYGTAVTLGNMLWIIPDAFKDVIFNRAAKKDNPKEILFAIMINFLLCLVIIVGFLFCGRCFLWLMYGEDYVDAYPLVLLLFIGTLPMILYKLIHPIYIANGNTGVVVRLLGIAVGVNIIGNFLLIPEFAGKGAAISSVVSYSICGIAFYRRFKKDYDIKSGLLLYKMISAVRNIRKDV